MQLQLLRIICQEFIIVVGGGGAAELQGIVKLLSKRCAEFLIPCCNPSFILLIFIIFCFQFLAVAVVLDVFGPCLLRSMLR